MAGTLGGLGGARTTRAMISGINVTPLVDVVLVLLVILMVASTYIVAQTLKVQLPKARSSDGAEEKPKSVVLMKDGSLRYDGEPATEDQIAKMLGSLVAESPETALVVSADKDVPHGRVVHIIDLAKLAGVTEFAINVELSP